MEADTSRGLNVSLKSRDGAGSTKSQRPRRKRYFDPAVITLMPSVIVLTIAVYVFIGWSVLISFTNSKFAPNFDFVGLAQYARLWNSDRWNVAVVNLGLFSVAFMLISLITGLLLAIFLDQKVRAEGTLRMIYLYPMAVSLIVTGTAWKWILNPGLGLEMLFHEIGWTSVHVNWLIDPKMSVYTLVIAAVWQTAGFVMAIFLAGLRGVDADIVKAAQMEGAGTTRIYLTIIIPMLRSSVFSVIVILIYQAVRSFDLVVALTNGGPGFSSDLPTTFMYNLTFSRGQLAQGAASSVMILLVVIVIVVPYLYSEFKREHHDSL
jgi:glucose/mannose transport system permease protein